MPLIWVENKNDSVVVGESAFIKLGGFQQCKRLELNYIQKIKKISSPEVVSAKLDAIGLDKIECLMEGDKNISNNKNYFLVYFYIFTIIIPAWGLATISLRDKLTM